MRLSTFDITNTKEDFSEEVPLSIISLESISQRSRDSAA